MSSIPKMNNNKRLIKIVNIPEDISLVQGINEITEQMRSYQHQAKYLITGLFVEKTCSGNTIWYINMPLNNSLEWLKKSCLYNERTYEDYLVIGGNKCSVWVPEEGKKTNIIWKVISYKHPETAEVVKIQHDTKLNAYQVAEIIDDACHDRRRKLYSQRAIYSFMRYGQTAYVSCTDDFYATRIQDAFYQKHIKTYRVCKMVIKVLENETGQLENTDDEYKAGEDLLKSPAKKKFKSDRRTQIKKPVEPKPSTSKAIEPESFTTEKNDIEETFTRVNTRLTSERKAEKPPKKKPHRIATVTLPAGTEELVIPAKKKLKITLEILSDSE